MLQIEPQSRDALDLLALGEVMLRLDPGEHRIRNARSFQAWEGGGEYNVARGLRKCFRLRTAICTALVANEIGYLVEDLIQQGGVDTQWIKWVPFDGVGRNSRNALNFVERGFGLRAPLGNSDRAYSPTSQLQPDDFDWPAIFAQVRPRWFHTGGVFTALGLGTPGVATKAVEQARAGKTVVSFDLNYRPSLWSCVADPEHLRGKNREIMAQAQVVFADPNSARACLGIKVPDLGPEAGAEVTFKSMAMALLEKFPNLCAVGGTHRVGGSMNEQQFQGFLWENGQIHRSQVWTQVASLDRIGSGDAFAAGVIYGLMEKSDPQWAVDLGTAHAILTTTTPGDNSMASLEDLVAILSGVAGLIRR
ncbi:MAG TPA: sugar kinase [Candidatus Limnocylindria bacterium]|jgi:2-dehydro-3-deoxygluconokinase|nr:sugar kinase [Candidatus Limnocylindria bacterium]